MSPVTIKQVNLPVIPNELIYSYEQVITLDPWVLKYEDGRVYDTDFYKVYIANKELCDWIKSVFEEELEYIEYLVAYKPLPMHKDLERTQAYNYVTETGGNNVQTEFYDFDRTTLLSSTECNPGTWYFLNVSYPHRVVGELTSPRVIISVTTKAASLPRGSQ